jgi:hypothetical protein
MAVGAGSEPRALLGEGDGGGTADASEATGDQVDLGTHALILAICFALPAEHGKTEGLAAL